MKRAARMMLLRNAGENRDRERYEREPRNNGDTYYVVTDRFRDRTGREHYDNGRYAPMRSYGGEMGYEMGYEMGGRERGVEMNRYSPTWDERRPESRMEYPAERAPRPVRGFMPESHYDIPGRGNEMEHRYSGYERGYGAVSGHSGALDHETLRHWMQGLRNEDGSTGAHWTVEQTTPLASPNGVDLNGEITPEIWNAAVNMMYSDYSGVANKLKVNTPEFYAGMAKAFLMDKDGGGAARKLAAYYRCVVE